LRDALLQLAQKAIANKLARATDAGSIFAAVAAGVFAGLSYPPALQEAHYAALDRAVTAKLEGDLTRQQGWSVARLYAAAGAVRVAVGAPADLHKAADHVARALSEPGVASPALAALAVSAARYAALGYEKKLDPGLSRVAAFPPARLEARTALRGAI